MRLGKLGWNLGVGKRNLSVNASECPRSRVTRDCTPPPTALLEGAGRSLYSSVARTHGNDGPSWGGWPPHARTHLGRRLRLGWSWESRYGRHAGRLISELNARCV